MNQCVCEYCYRETLCSRYRAPDAEDYDYVYLCDDCRADVAYCERKGKERGEP